MSKVSFLMIGICKRFITYLTIFLKKKEPAHDILRAGSYIKHVYGYEIGIYSGKFMKSYLLYRCKIRIYFNVSATCLFVRNKRVLRVFYKSACPVNNLVPVVHSP